MYMIKDKTVVLNVFFSLVFFIPVYGGGGGGGGVIKATLMKF